MPWCMQYFDGQFTDFKSFPVFCNVCRKHGSCTRPIHDDSIGGLAQVNMTTHKICMKMSFKNVFDFCLALIGEVEININIPEWIDDSGHAITLNIVRGFADTARI